jgi:MFS family permease
MPACEDTRDVPAARVATPSALAPALPELAWPAEQGHPQRWRILVVLAAVAFMAQLDLFIVNIAVPSMSRSFSGAGLSSLSWVLNAYAIVFAALLVPAGRLADHFGRRRFLLAGVAIFTAASVLCAVAPVLGVLIAGRVLQAAGAAAIVPASLGLLLPSFPARQQTAAVGVWAGVAAVAASSGAPVGGLLVGFSWRWIFLVNVPIGVATIVAGLRILPEVRAPRGTRQATRPDRHHASRRSSSVQAMAYTRATPRHITPKPGQGGRVWAEWWTSVICIPAWVGQNSVTGLRHESGSAWAIPGRTSRTAIMLAMAAAGCRSKAPAATLSTARAARYSPPPATARNTPGSPSAACGAWPLMRAWPTKNAAKQVTSPTTKVTAAKTSDLAASSRPRFGTAVRLARIIPEEYSELMHRTPSTAMASEAMATPAWLYPVGSQLSLPETLIVA